MADVADSNAGEPASVKQDAGAQDASSGDASWTDVAKQAVSAGLHSALDAISHTVHDAAEAVKSAIHIGGTESKDDEEEEEEAEGDDTEEPAKEGATDDSAKAAKPRRKRQKKAASGESKESHADTAALVQQAIQAAQNEVADRHPAPLTVQNAKNFVEAPDPRRKLESKAIPSTYNPPEPQHLKHDARGPKHLLQKDSYLIMPRQGKNN